MSPRPASTGHLVASAAVLLAALHSPAAGQDLAAMEERTTVHRLANGWTFLIVERPKAPVFSFVTLVDTGSVDEVPGITGLAHMFEHMAFKGSQTIGTRDYAKEKPAIETMEAAYQAWQAERLAPRPDATRLADLRQAFEEKRKAAAAFAVQGAFSDLLEREGAVSFNATTGADRTEYFYSLPANKVELWAFAESDRFFHPVLREFYEERDVVHEERRMRVESNPIGRLVEQWVTTAFACHPYQQPGIGIPSDLDSLSLTDAWRFYETYYAPSNMITAVVGDVDAKALIPILERYFGRIPARAPRPALRTVEPPQIAERIVLLRDPGQPLYLESFHKPAETDPDEPVYDAIDDVLSNGRTSRLYRALVRDQGIAVETGSFSGFPGPKYPNLWSVYAFPAVGVRNEKVQVAIRQQIARLQDEDVTDEELTRFRTRARADLIRSLESNLGLARALAEHQRLYGDWRELFRYLGRLETVSKGDIRRVAKGTFRAANRVVAEIVHEEPPAGAAQEDGQ